MADKTIYDLTENQSLDAGDLFEQDVLQNNERKSLKTSLGAIAEKINTSLTYSGLNTTSKTVVGAINELEAGGGGGTGGHTIINENGTSMTARSGLQFFGAVEVTDDSTNNRTLVEVLGGDFYNPIIYSTTEREIGVWTDGKPLYQKTVIKTSGFSVGASNSISLGISNIDYICFVCGSFHYGSNNSSLTLPFGDDYKPVTNSVVHIESISASNGTINVGIGSNYSGAYAPNKIVITVQYTKTTDTAGSGVWTPQGVPAVHYSTEEQVIGTWLGETLYQKTYHNVSMTNNADNVVDSNFGTDKVLQSFRLDTKGMVNTLFNYSTTLDDTLFVNNGVLKYYLAKTGTWWNALNTVDITIQYTKSS